MTTRPHSEPARGRRMPLELARTLSSAMWPPVLLAAVLMTAWWSAAEMADSTVFPAPPASLDSLVADLGHSEYRQALAGSMRLFAESYAAAVVVGTVVGIIIGLNAFWSEVFLPILYSLNSIPKVVLYPMFLLFLGIGDMSRGGFAFVSGVVPMLLIVIEGSAEVSRVHLKLAAGLGMSYAAVVRKIVIPTMVPSLAKGARLTFGLTFLGLLLAEMLSGSSGLGHELLRNVSLVRLQNILGEVVLIAVLALVPTLLLRWIERRVQRRYGR